MFKIILGFHISVGFVALLSGLLAMIVPKTRKYHTKLGKVYSLAMAVVVVSSLIMGIWHENYFLFAIGVFSGYFVFMGWRSLNYRKPEFKNSIHPMDKIIITSMIVFNLAILVFYFYIFKSTGKVLIIPILFGVLGVFLQYRDYLSFMKVHKDSRFWMKKHLSSMIAGYISTFTAFAVTNLNFLPSQFAWINWIWPSILGSIYITFQIMKIEKKRKLGNT